MPQIPFYPALTPNDHAGNSHTAKIQVRLLLA